MRYCEEYKETESIYWVQSFLKSHPIQGTLCDIAKNFVVYNWYKSENEP